MLAERHIYIYIYITKEGIDSFTPTCIYTCIKYCIDCMIVYRGIRVCMYVSVNGVIIVYVDTIRTIQCEIGDKSFETMHGGTGIS